MKSPENPESNAPEQISEKARLIAAQRLEYIYLEQKHGGGVGFQAVQTFGPKMREEGMNAAMQKQVADLMENPQFVADCQAAIANFHSRSKEEDPQKEDDHEQKLRMEKANRELLEIVRLFQANRGTVENLQITVAGMWEQAAEEQTRAAQEMSRKRDIQILRTQFEKIQPNNSVTFVTASGNKRTFYIVSNEKGILSARQDQGTQIFILRFMDEEGCLDIRPLEGGGHGTKTSPVQQIIIG